MLDAHVRARLTFQAQSAAGGLKSVNSGLEELQRNIRGAERASGGLFRQLLAMGGAYAGLNLVTRAFHGLIGQAQNYTAEIEATKIGLQSVLMAVEKTDWETAGKRAEYAFEQIRKASLKSPATPQEMLKTFSGIVGPIESAGFGMEKVLEMTSDAVLAGNALKIDMDQTQRDMSMLVRGTAGTDVNLFSIMQSMGVISEDAEAWNKSLTQAQRVEKLAAALATMRDSGEAFGRSWKGVSSSFVGIAQEQLRSFWMPIQGVLSENLLRFNTFLLGHEEALKRWLTAAGMWAGSKLEDVFSRAHAMFWDIVNDWDSIVAHINQAIDRAKLIGNALLEAGKIWLAVSVARSAAGMVVGGARAATAGAQGLAMVGANVNAFKQARAQGGGLGDTIGKLLTGSLVGAGTAAGGGAAAGGAGIFAGLKVALVALQPLLLPVAAVLVALAAVFLSIKDNAKAFASIFMNTVGQLLLLLIATGLAAWAILKPILTAIGNLITFVATLIGGLIVNGLKPFALVLLLIASLFAKLVSWGWGYIKPLFDWLFEALDTFFKFLADQFSWLMSEIQRMGVDTPGLGEGSDGGFLAQAERWLNEQKKALDGIDGKSKGDKVIKQDFRGSKFQIRQDFKGNTDPDRVVAAMLHDLSREAESRTTSGYSGALTR